MKKHRFLCLLAIILLTCPSCSIQKKRYSAGFNLHFEFWGRSGKEAPKTQYHTKKNVLKSIFKDTLSLVIADIDTSIAFVSLVTDTSYHKAFHNSPKHEPLKEQVRFKHKPSPQVLLSPDHRPGPPRLTNDASKPVEESPSYGDGISIYAILSVIFGLAGLAVFYFAYTMAIYYLLWVLLLLALLTIVFSLISFREINSGRRRGKIFSIFGIILYVAEILGLGVLFLNVLFDWLFP